MDYSPSGSDELALRKDDRLRVFKRYNHYSYVRPNLSLLHPLSLLPKLTTSEFVGRQRGDGRTRLESVLVRRQNDAGSSGPGGSCDDARWWRWWWWWW
jgi:hypothetical protein